VKGRYRSLLTTDRNADAKVGREGICKMLEVAARSRDRDGGLWVSVRRCSKRTCRSFDGDGIFDFDGVRETRSYRIKNRVGGSSKP
jgi:hypothetical protein